MRVLLDRSAAVRLVMRAEGAERLLEPIASAVLFLAPGLYASEVANALCKYVQAGNLDLDTALERARQRGAPLYSAARGRIYSTTRTTRLVVGAAPVSGDLIKKQLP